MRIVIGDLGNLVQSNDFMIKAEKKRSFVGFRDRMEEGTRDAFKDSKIVAEENQWVMI